MNVTDHATLRYIERVLGFDVEDVRQRIRDVCENAAKAGASCVVHDGFQYKIAHGGRAVITVTPTAPHSETGGYHPAKRKRWRK